MCIETSTPQGKMTKTVEYARFMKFHIVSGMLPCRETTILFLQVSNTARFSKKSLLTGQSLTIVTDSLVIKS